MNKRPWFVLLLLTQPLWAGRFGSGDLDVSLRHFFNSSQKLLSAGGDFNGDGKQDICMQESASQHSLILGGPLPKQADLSSVPRTTILLPIPVTFFPTPPFFADINGDGKDDLFIPDPIDLTSLSTMNVYVIFGSSTVPSLIDLTTASDLTIEFPVTGILGIHFAKGDFDGDGKVDVVMSGLVLGGSSEFFLMLGRSLEGQNIIHLGDGISAVHFYKPYPSNLPMAPPALGDLNGDGLSDLVLSDLNADITGRNDAGQAYVFFGTTVAFLPGSMDWNFGSKPSNVTITGRAASGKMACHAVGDFTGDGKADLAFVEGGGTELILWDGGVISDAGPQIDLAVGIPGHSPVWRLGGMSDAPSSSRFGDFDGDGRVDLFTIDGNFKVIGGLSTTPIQQDGGPILPSTLDYSWAKSFDLGDINGDGKKDLVLTGEDGSLGIIYGYRPLDNPSVRVKSGSVPPKVVLEFSVEGEPTEVMVGGDVVGPEKDRWIPYQPSLPVTVSQTEGKKSIQVVFRNRFRRESNEVEATLTLTPATPSFQVIDNVIDSQNGTARVDCHLDASTHVKAAVYDQSGALISEVLDATLSAGVWPIEWDGNNDSGGSVSPGVYYLAAEKHGKSERKKILVRR